MIRWIGKMFAMKEERRSVRVPRPDALRQVFGLPVHEQWLSEEEIDRILQDGTVIADIGSRKSATLKKELQVETQSKAIEAAVERLATYAVMRQILDTSFQGFCVFELNYTVADDGYAYPMLHERNYRDFIVDDGVLLYQNEPVPPNKAAWATYESKHNHPMGRPLARALFWPVKFKSASAEFWLRFLEKYGSPWAIGKTPGDKNEMADNIYAMLSGDVAVIEDDETLELIAAQKPGDHQAMIEYCKQEIHNIVLGGNLTAEVKGGSYAASQTHNQVREDIAQSEETIVLHVLRQAIDAFCAVNGITEPYTLSLFDEDDPNIALSERDKRISEMGWRPTKAYIEKTYGIQVEEAQPATPIAGKRYAFSARRPIDELERQLRAMSTRPVERALLDQVEAAMDGAGSFEEAIDAIYRLYPQMSTEALESAMENAYLHSQILGAAEVEDESDAD